MSHVKRFALALCLILLVPAAAQAAGKPPPLTILVSIDGFRADYLDRGLSPNLSALAASGARPRGGMRPSFPSLTFPNHYALVTGLRPDRNGIVDNVMRDEARPGMTFGMGKPQMVTDAFWWDQAEPIWVTAQKAGMPTATMFWPGSEAPIRGVWPTYYKPYDKTFLAPDRVNQVLTWLDLPAARRPRLVTLYFDLVDTAGHHAGPDSQEVNDAIASTDQAIGQLVAGLKARGLYGRTNLVIVADHGMAQTSPERVVYLDDVFDLERLGQVTGGSMSEMNPADPQALAAILAPHDHFQCWKKADVPERFHFGKNPRVPAVVCLAETGWTITTKAYAASRPMKTVGGAHGYDPYDPQMAALFIAEGPKIRRGVTVEPFDNVDVYVLVARLAGIKALPGDGRLPKGVLR
ncbi:putative AlkP superfamily pyrophosphatase or phosphodiesterase [Caulobacter ginsengisoli]|uniref:AlkP superfamily pyrophosphatase or phosphodiesterase n=1 Tax=Caulobacter ginsengisoli TaxID=400775 RepID=A0ABU0ILD0_9CAUL|nr:ectonucleotide pyrophosphatase/phosphodiesterase [Caulobacter ginsengisoli]MDQ0462769.1 putative AlkP superfamily pyrophosphatase or phosphodiesterase [Caulobacter ginsengisoli]